MSKEFAEVFGTLQTTTAPNSAVVLDVAGLGGVGIQITGTFTGTVNFEGSVDGSTFLALNVVATNGSSAVTSATAVGAWQGSCVGLKTVRCRMSGSPTGAAVVTMYAELASPGGAGGSGGGGGAVTLQQSLDGDTGGGTASTDVVLLGLPASGGPVAGGTAANPFAVVTNGLPLWDYMGQTVTSSTIDTFVFKTGGSGGTTVATVVVTYTDSTHAVLSNVTRT